MHLFRVNIHISVEWHLLKANWFSVVNIYSSPRLTRVITKILDATVDKAIGRWFDFLAISPFLFFKMRTSIVVINCWGRNPRFIINCMIIVIRTYRRCDAYLKCSDIKPSYPGDLLFGSSLMEQIISSTVTKTSVVSWLFLIWYKAKCPVCSAWHSRQDHNQVAKFNVMMLCCAGH